MKSGLKTLDGQSTVYETVAFMKIKLLKSKLPANFDQQVEAFRQALLKHRFTKGKPAPAASHIIENCIIRVRYPIKDKKPDDFITNYEIVDDSVPSA